jgi:hypothetical protein
MRKKLRMHPDLKPWGWNWLTDSDSTDFKMGTMQGLLDFSLDDGSYHIIALLNTKPGNGQFAVFMQWFEGKCRQDGKNSVVDELWNDRLKAHFLNKRGYVIKDDKTVIKYFKEIV